MSVTPRDPSPTPWLITAAVVAYGVGSLFRAYTTTGIALYRMFGTIGIVIIGYLGTRVIVASVTAEGRRKLREALADLPEGFLLVPQVALTDGQGRKVDVEYLIVGRGAVHLLAVDETPPHTRSRGRLQRRQRMAARLWQAYRLCHQLLRGQGINNYAVQPALLATLAQPAQDQSTPMVDGLPVVAPEQLAQHLETYDQAPDPHESIRRGEPGAHDQERLHSFFAGML